MAKKQKKELPPEERLAAARVPEEEWPYELPEDWAWVYIKAGFEVTSSKRVHKEDWLSDGIPFYRTRELVKLSDDGYVENELFISEQLYNEFKESYGVPQEGDILISGVGTIGVPYIVDSSQKFYFKDGNVIWFKNLGLFLPKYIFYLYKSQFMYNQLHAMSSGTTVDTYTIVNAKKTKVPLPPLEIQQQIVTNIERLFAKLDQAKEKAQQTLATAEPRKAAILHQAFTGQLTEKWRAENGVAIESWETLTLNDCGEWNGGGTPSMQHDEYWENGNIPWITSKDMKSNLIEDTLMHVNMVGVENSSAKLIEKPSLLFVTRSGILRRMLPIAMVKKAFTVNQDLKVLTPSEEINLDYLFWACRAKEREILATCMKSGTTVESINFSALKQVEIPIPSLEEQKHIALVLDFLLEDEGNFRKKVIEVIDSCDATKKAILAKAFRGEWQQRP